MGEKTRVDFTILSTLIPTINKYFMVVQYGTNLSNISDYNRMIKSRKCWLHTLGWNNPYVECSELANIFCMDKHQFRNDLTSWIYEVSH